MIASAIRRPTIHDVTTGGDPLQTPLTTLALGLAETFDAGWDVHSVLAVLIADPTEADGLTRQEQAEVVTDLVLAAASLLAGIAPDLPGLVSLWGRPRLVEVAYDAQARAAVLTRPT